MLHHYYFLRLIGLDTQAFHSFGFELRHYDWNKPENFVNLVSIIITVLGQTKETISTTS